MSIQLDAFLFFSYPHIYICAPPPFPFIYSRASADLISFSRAFRKRSKSRQPEKKTCFKWKLGQQRVKREEGPNGG